jgi:hypothetical protein
METPYINTLKQTLDNQNNLLLLLENRIDYLKTEIQNCQSFNYHTNEAGLNIIKTEAEIETLKKVIAEKTAYFEKYAAHFEVEYAEMERKYDKLMENAYLRAAKIPVLKSMLEKVNKQALKTDKEAKLAFYKKVKQLLV